MKKPASDKKPTYVEAFREEALARLKAGDRIGGPNGIMAPLMQEFIQASLEGEMDAHLEEGPESNRRNGKGKKRVRSEGGILDLELPRDRDGTFTLRL